MDRINNDPEKHLRVYEDRSEYISEDGNIEVFPEGVISSDAKRRIKKVKDAFKNGFLDNLIVGLSNGEFTVDITKISDVAVDCVTELVDSVTSEVGRALIGLSVMQLCVKAIEPRQNIRLHKGGSSSSSFSWVEGISMRALDKNHVTPTLRKYDLLRLNADGFMMTRSLAENYPYTSLYKAYIRGGRKQWLLLVEEIEKEQTSAIETLKYMLARLINAASEFESSANQLIAIADEFLTLTDDIVKIKAVIIKHSEMSDYAARLLEINMHALMQAAFDAGAFGSAELVPLSQMRSANKKHGNIGDIELIEDGEIIESWDAKYGKGYLREEIEEVKEKLPDHDVVETVGFVTNVPIVRNHEITQRIQEIEQLYQINLMIISYEDWVQIIFQRTLDVNSITAIDLAKNWLKTYCEYLAQRRRIQAPIDEPCQTWVNSLHQIISDSMK